MPQFGLAVKKKDGETAVETAEVKPMDEELQIEEDLQRLKKKESAEKKRAKRRENERKQKEIVRLQLHMTAPTEIGQEQNWDSMFGLKPVDKAGALEAVAKGKMNVVVEDDRKRKDIDMGDAEEDDTEDEEADRLEAELDGL